MNTYRVVATYPGGARATYPGGKTLTQAQADILRTAAEYLEIGYHIVSVRDVEIVLEMGGEKIMLAVQEVDA